MADVLQTTASQEDRSLRNHRRDLESCPAKGKKTRLAEASEMLRLVRKLFLLHLEMETILGSKMGRKGIKF